MNAQPVFAPAPATEIAGPVAYDACVAARLFGYMVTKGEFDDFLTLPAYEYLP